MGETFLGNEGHAIHGSPLDDEGCFSVLGLGISHESEEYTGWWFQTCLFSPLFGEDSHFD